MRKIRLAITSAVGALIFGTLALISPATAELAPSQVTPQAPVSVLAWTQYDYYNNYFLSEGTCNNRGRWMSVNVEGVIGWYCHRHAGYLSWSMDVHWSTP